MTIPPLPFPRIGRTRSWIAAGGRLCENPLWDAATRRLCWTDIPAGRIFAAEGMPSKVRCIYEGPSVGGFTLQHDGALLLFRERDVALLDGAGNTTRVLPFSHAGSARFNDVIADPEGRVFAGTIGKTSISGGLFRFERDGTWTEAASGTGCSNGLAFSPGNDFLYWVCSTRRVVFRFPYRCETGALGEPSALYRAGDGEGIPDGLAVDAVGRLHLVHWGAEGFGLSILSPEGAALHRHPLPSRTPTSACFCGPDLRHLAVTAAHEDGEARTSDLFLIPMPYAGKPEYRSRIHPR